jgi:hypothetical protein
MRILRYEGPGHFLNVDGQLVKRGTTVELDDDTASRLLADSRQHVTDETPPEPHAFAFAGLQGDPETEPDPQDEVNKEA